MKAIVYESNAGHTKEYARMLSEKLNIPYFTRKEATKQLKKSSEIIYLGWVCATKVQGLKKVISKYQVKCIIAVGIYPNSNEYIESLKNSNNIEGHFFYLQGGLDCKKLKGMKKKKVTIVPSTLLRLGVWGSRFVPTRLLIRIVGRQQQKKMWEKK